jgi:arylsulfatase A-like enzyme
MLQAGNEPWHTGTTGHLRGAKGSTYEGGMRVPGIAWWPGQIPREQVSADLATTMDLFATVAAMTGGELPQDRTMDSQNLLPMFKGQADSPRQAFFYCRRDQVEAVREGRWKYRLSRHLRTDLNPGDETSAELFDLEVDASERYNVAQRHPEIVARLHERLKVMAQENSRRLQQYVMDAERPECAAPTETVGAWGLDIFKI